MWSLVLIAVVSTSNQRALVVSLTESSTPNNVMPNLQSRIIDEGLTPLSHEATCEALYSTPEPRNPNVEALENMLHDARDRAARFDLAGANDLRERIWRTVDNLLHPDSAAQVLAVEAALDLVAELAPQQRETAALLAIDVIRRFPDVALDTQRYSPSVHELFTQAKKTVSSMPTGDLQVVADAPGALIIDGRPTVAITDQVTPIHISLPVGSYRVWHVAGKTVSRPKQVFITHESTHHRVTSNMDGRLTCGTTLELRCDTTCDLDLRELAQMVDVSKVFAVRPLPNGTSELLVFDSPTQETHHYASLTDTQPTRTTRIGPELFNDRGPRPYDFQPLFLIPFGVGQFVQGRPISGSLFLAGQTGVLIWHLVSWRQHATILRSDDLHGEARFRQQRNLSAGLFYGLMVANIVEAFAVDYFSR